jgi:hypothetical protein
MAIVEVPTTGAPGLEEVLWGIQIAFFLVTAIVAIVTYRSAKRSVFQPIRTEIFKIQLADVQMVLDDFAGKSGFSLADNLDWNAMVAGNSNLMYMAYAETFLGVKIDESKAAHTELIPIKRGLMNPDELELVVDHLEGPNEEPEVEPMDVDPAAAWQQYEHRRNYGVSERYEDELRRIRRLGNRPLLPTKLVDLIDDYRQFAEQQLLELIEILTAASREMPSKYPTFVDLQSGVYTWIMARCQSPVSGLGTRAAGIVAFVKEYYAPDRLMPSRVVSG